MKLQKQNSGIRETLINNVVKLLYSDLKDNPNDAVNLRKPFQAELFRLAMKQVSPFGSFFILRNVKGLCISDVTCAVTGHFYYIYECCASNLFLSIRV